MTRVCFTFRSTVFASQILSLDVYRLRLISNLNAHELTHYYYLPRPQIDRHLNTWKYMTMFNRHCMEC